MPTKSETYTLKQLRELVNFTAQMVDTTEVVVLLDMEKGITAPISGTHIAAKEPLPNQAPLRQDCYRL